MRGIFLIPDQIGQQNLANAALSFTTSYRRRFKLEQVIVHFSQAVSETITISLISKNGSNYNTVLVTVVLVGETDFVFRPQGDANFQTGDQIQVNCTNANLIGTGYVSVKSSELGGGG